MSEHRPWLGPAHDILKAMCNEWRDSDIRADNREYLRRLNEAFASLTATVEQQATRIGELERELEAERERVARSERIASAFIAGDLSSSEVARQRMKSAEQQLAEAQAHQRNADTRITNQRQEIHNLQHDLTGARTRLNHFDQWKRECEQWKDTSSVFWEVARDEKVKSLKEQLAERTAELERARAQIEQMRIAAEKIAAQAEREYWKLRGWLDTHPRLEWVRGDDGPAYPFLSLMKVARAALTGESGEGK